MNCRFCSKKYKLKGPLQKHEKMCDPNYLSADVLDYGKENREYISYDNIKEWFGDNDVTNLIVKYIDNVYNHIDHPENNNVKYIGKNTCLVKQNNQWCKLHVDKATEMIYNDSKKYINDLISDHKEKELWKILDSLENGTIVCLPND